MLKLTLNNMTLDVISLTIKYNKESIRNILEKFHKRFSENPLILVFDDKDLKPEEYNLVKHYHNPIHLGYSKFKDSLFKITGTNNSRIELDTEKTISLLNNLTNKMGLFDFYVIGEKFLFIFSHKGEIAILKRSKENL